MTDEELEALAESYQPEPADDNAPEMTDADLEALADSYQPEEDTKEKGPLAQAFDKYAAKANEIGDTISEGFSDFTREVGPLFKALEPLKSPAKAVLGGVDVALDTLNRATGTTVGTALDTFINPMMNPESFSFSRKAQERIASQKETGTQEYPILDKVMPIRLAEDVAYPIGEGVFKNIAEGLRLTGNETAEDVAYVVDGFAPGAGMAASFLATANMPIPKIGALTKAGVQAEKTGALAKGAAKQMQQGQRGLIGLEVGGIGLPRKELFNLGGQSAAKSFDKINNIVTKAEVAELFIPGTKIPLPNPARIAGKALSKSSHPLVNEFVENFNMAKNAIAYDADDLYRNMNLKAKSLGVDIADEATRKTLYRYLDNPSAFAKDPRFKQYERMFNYLDDSLKREVELNRQKGIPVPTKVFESPTDPALKATMSERYVPRGAPLSKRQELMAKKKLKTFEDVEKYMEQISDTKFGGKKLRGFQMQRAPMNRDAMNRYMKEKYDIDDFFHDDFVAAYTDKIAELRRARVEKEFTENLMNTFGKSEAEYLELVRGARDRVRSQRAQGIVPSSDDVFMAALSPRGLRRLEMLPEPVRARLTEIGALSKDVKGARNLRLPEEIADYVTDVLYKPNYNEVASGMLAYQNAMKGFMFFNPGYHIRNFAESFSRGIGYGVGPLETAKSSAALFRNKGEYAKYIDDFKKLSSDTGFFSLLDEAGEAVPGVTSVPRGHLRHQNAQKLLGSAMKEIVAKGKWKEFLQDLRANKANIRENPLFKFSSQVGVQGENISKFGLFSVLREQGYNAQEAMRKVNRVFPDYQITRSGVRNAQLVAPFANYFIKNAETTLKILSEAPRGAAAFGPQGALQRSFENWAGFDPERTYRYKELIGDWADDYIFFSVMPTAENMDNNPDFIKQAVGWMNEGLEPGEVIWLRLPSNTHALKQLNPSQLHENWGPLVRAASALIGRDPFTGQPLIGKGTGEQGSERIDAAIKELTSPMMPQTAIPAAQELMDQQFGEWREKLLNAGVSEDVTNVVFGKKLDAKKEKARRALTKVKTLWAGGATQIDLQATFGAMARMKDAEKYVKDIFKQIESGKRDAKEEDRALNELDRAYEDIVKLFEANGEFQSAIENAGGLPDMRFEYNVKDEIPEPQPLIPDVPEDDADLDEAEYDSYLEDVSEGREPQGSFEVPDPVYDAINKVRDFEIEQSILAESDLSTPEGAQQAFDTLVNFFQQRIEKEFGDKSPQFKQDLLETIKQEFYDANRLATQGSASRMPAAERAFSELGMGGGGNPGAAALGLGAASMLPMLDDEAPPSTPEVEQQKARQQDVEAGLGSRLLKDPEYRRLYNMTPEQLAEEPAGEKRDRVLEIKGLEKIGIGKNPGFRFLEALASPMGEYISGLGFGMFGLPGYTIVDVEGNTYEPHLDEPDYKERQEVEKKIRREFGKENYYISGPITEWTRRRLGNELYDKVNGRMQELLKENPKSGYYTDSWTRAYAPNPDTYLVFEAQRNKKSKKSSEKDALARAYEYAKKAGYKYVAIVDAPTAAEIQGHGEVADWIHARYNVSYPSFLEKITGSKGVEKQTSISGQDLPLNYMAFEIKQGDKK